MSDRAADEQQRREQVRRELGSGQVTGLRDLASRLQAEGIAAGPDQLRADARALGAVRVQMGETSVLALPVGSDGKPAAQPSTVGVLAAEVSSDPDWKLQVGVVAVVALFLLVAFLGWLISS